MVSTNLANFKPNKPQQSSSTCIGSPGPSLSGSDKRVLTPEKVRPYPKAQLRKKSEQGRKKGRTCALTDTPEKDRVEEEMKKRKFLEERIKMLKLVGLKIQENVQ